MTKCSTASAFGSTCQRSLADSGLGHRTELRDCRGAFGRGAWRVIGQPVIFAGCVYEMARDGCLHGAAPCAHFLAQHHVGLVGCDLCLAGVDLCADALVFDEVAS